jgi:hypothetical protein
MELEAGLLALIVCSFSAAILITFGQRCVGLAVLRGVSRVVP